MRKTASSSDDNDSCYKCEEDDLTEERDTLSKPGNKKKRSIKRVTRQKLDLEMLWQAMLKRRQNVPSWIQNQIF